MWFAVSHVQRYEEAEKAYTKAVQLDPNYKDASDELFQIRMEQLQVCCRCFLRMYNVPLHKPRLEAH